MSLAVVDWGIGGVPTWQALRERAPSLDLVYVSDSGYEPYGKVPDAILVQRLTTLVGALSKRGVTFIAVACNAASSVLHALPSLECELTGIIDDGVTAALASDAQIIGILGGERTILAGAHAARIKDAGREVIAIAAQPLSAHVEAGRLSGDEVEADLKRVLAPMKNADAILLACTHYPALTGLFRQFTRAELLDPGDLFVERVLKRVDSSDASSVLGTRLVLTTGDPNRTHAAALRAFGVDVGLVRRMSLP